MSQPWRDHPPLVSEAWRAARRSREGHRVKLTVRASEPAFARVLARLRRRGATADAGVEPAVRAILDDVRKRGDRAVADATLRFDRVKLKASERTIEREAMRAACDLLSRAELHALRVAARRIRDFHEHQKERSFRYRDALGVTLGQEIRPLRRVGLYVPGGQAFYPSSVLMNALPARVAGVEDIVAVSPPHEGGEPPALLAAAYIAGVDRIHRIGGAQAVGALAYGTATVERVDKIVGPGNIYVATAKRLVSGVVGIDMIAGPSEVLIVADAQADPELIAADMLAQAEHDADATSIVVTPSGRLAAAIERALDEQLTELPRASTAAKALRANGAILVVKSVEQAVDLANELAPEHLELALDDAQKWIPRIEHAGAIFVGESTPEAFGDYLAGPNHVLPTGGTARFSSPLGVYDFVKRTSIIMAPPRVLERLAEPVLRLAEMEGLHAHGAAVARRLQRARRSPAR